MIPWTDLHIEFDDEGNVSSTEICFSHVDDIDGTVRHFAIDRIVKAITLGQMTPRILEFPIDPMFAVYAMQHRGIEQHRFQRITPQDVAHYPVVLAHMPGVGKDTQGNHLIIDGSHRYCRAFQLGWKTLRGYELSPAMWEPFLIDIPEELCTLDRERLQNQHINPIDSHIP